MNEPFVWRALARFNPVSMKVSVVVGRRDQDGSAQYLADLAQFGTIEQRDLGDNTPPPELHMEESVAKALLEALAEHFGGASDTRQLRKDYEAERARVDKLLAVTCRPPFVVNGQAEPPIINLGGRT